MAIIPLFKVSHGLNNKIDSARLAYSPQQGVIELSEGYNVDVGDAGDVSRRLGYSATDITTECHSLFWDGGVCLFVTGDALTVLSADFVGTPIRNVTRGARMMYAQIADTTYYMNGFECGYVQNERSYTWIKPAVVPQPDQTRVYSDPPVGTIVRYYGGRIWIVKGKALYFSEPYQYSLFNLGRNVVAFTGKITMLAPVLDGLYVSTDTAIFFCNGNPPQMTIQKKANYPAVFGTDDYVDGVSIQNGKLTDEVVPVFTTIKGICVGLPGGRLINLTYERLTYPNAVSGCALYTGSKYIVSMEP